MITTIWIFCEKVIFFLLLLLLRLSCNGSKKYLFLFFWVSLFRNLFSCLLERNEPIPSYLPTNLLDKLLAASSSTIACFRTIYLDFKRCFPTYKKKKILCLLPNFSSSFNSPSLFATWSFLLLLAGLVLYYSCSADHSLYIYSIPYHIYI